MGPGEFDGGWWQLGTADVTARACLLDDVYALNADGSFENRMGGETWLEGWQGADEGCGAPVEPHDGTAEATWSYDEAAGELTVSGMGAFMGLAKAYNGGELAAPYEAPASITYNVHPQDDGSLLVTIPVADPGWWTFKLVRE